MNKNCVCNGLRAIQGAVRVRANQGIVSGPSPSPIHIVSVIAPALTEQRAGLEPTPSKPEAY